MSRADNCMAPLAYIFVGELLLPGVGALTVMSRVTHSGSTASATRGVARA